MKNLPLSRRRFLGATGVAALAASGVAPALRAQTTYRPVAIASGNGLKAVTRAMELLQQGADALDAVVAGVNLIEDDPTDQSVGYGGLPNEEGVVELDASVMHGPTGRGGAVAALQNIRYASRVARRVMERTDHVLLVGAGALKFARAHGFKEENLLTDEAREAWLRWKEALSNQDDWLPPHELDTRDIGQSLKEALRHYGTINCNAVDLRGGVSGCTTTSGLAFKIPGRVGDSPILGAGLWVDNDVGAAGSTGRGEANLLACSSVMIVEWLRQGLAPTDACLRACRRIVAQTRMKRLLDDQGRPKFNVSFYALTKAGAHGGASLWGGIRYAVNTGEGESRLVDMASLY
jgi:N4-(beta-N-acetylglucosaminyl)-L-asparaginase